MSKFQIKQEATAGTLESSDIQIMIAENSSGIEIDLKSSVEKQYGKRIREVVTGTLKNMGIDSAKVTAVDKGALDCTIIARTVTAVHRASGIVEDYNWEEVDSWSV